MRSEAEADIFERLANRFTATPVKSVDFVAKMLADAVRNARDYDMFVDTVIIGKQARGKSTLALYVMYIYYYGNKDKVLNNVFFDVEDLLEALTGEKRELVLLDDAGVTLTKYRAMTQEAVDFVIFLNPVRKRLHGLLYTTVYDNIIKFVRVTSEYLIIMYNRVGSRVYGLLRRTHIGRAGVYRKDVCKFVMDLDELHQDPDFHDLYKAYDELRKEFTDRVNMQLLERIRERRKKTL